MPFWGENSKLKISVRLKNFLLTEVRGNLKKNLVKVGPRLNDFRVHKTVGNKIRR